MSTERQAGSRYAKTAFLKEHTGARTSANWRPMSKEQRWNGTRRRWKAALIWPRAAWRLRWNTTLAQRIAASCSPSITWWWMEFHGAFFWKTWSGATSNFRPGRASTWVAGHLRSNDGAMDCNATAKRKHCGRKPRIGDSRGRANPF